MAMDIGTLIKRMMVLLAGYLPDGSMIIGINAEVLKKSVVKLTTDLQELFIQLLHTLLMIQYLD